MKTFLIRSSEVAADDLAAVHTLLSQVDGPIRFTALDEVVTFDADAKVLDWTTIFGEIREIRRKAKIEPEDYLVLLTSIANDQNWFSAAEHGSKQNVFVHTANWDVFIPCESKFPIAFQVVETLIHTMMKEDYLDIVEAVHDPPIGCIGDMCTWKQHISFKVRTADICPDCLDCLHEQGVEDEVIQQCLALIESLRDGMLFSRDYRGKRSGPEDGMPFPVAITRRKLASSAEPLRKFLFLLDHFDSLVRTTVTLGGCVLLGDEFGRFLRKGGLSDRPSLGKWVSALGQLSRLARERQSELLPLPDDFAERLKDVISESDEGKLVQLRNERRGHGYCDCRDAAYDDIFNSYLPRLDYIENLLVPVLRQLKVHFVIAAEHVGKGKFKIRTRPLMGNHPEFPENAFEISAKNPELLPTGGAVFVAPRDRDDEWHCLDPYVKYISCPECQHTRVLVIDGKKYLDPYIGHLVQLPSQPE